MTAKSISRRQLLGRGSLLLSGLAILSACDAPPAAAPAKPADAPKPADAAKPAEAAKPAAPAAAPAATSAPAAAAAPAKPAEAAKPGAAPAAGGVTLTIWNNQDNWTHTGPYWIEQTAQKFPGGGLTINPVQIPYADFEAKYLAAFSAGSGAPDLFIGQVANYAGALDVVEPLPKEIGDRFEKDVLKAISQFHKYNGNWMGMPISSDLGMMLIYNTDHFTEVGLDPAKPPTTMTELRDAAIKLTKKDASGEVTRPGHTIRATSAPVGIADKFLPYLHAFGGRLYAEDGTKATGTTNGPEAVEALTFVTDLILKDKAANPQLGNPEDQFAAGTASMIFRESWFVGAMKDRGPNVKFDTVLLPKQKAYPGISLLFNWSLMVYKKSPGKDMAMKWLNFINVPEHDLAIAKMEKYLPILTASFSDPYIADRKDNKVMQQIMAAPPGPYYNHPRINQVADRIGRAIEESTLGKRQPKEALDAAAADVDKIMARR
jgi:multiple sugar transport system substrate-binding protein